jgi:hypothetical protein
MDCRSSPATPVQRSWIDSCNQFEQLIERPVSVQPLPDKIQVEAPDFRAGVMVITNGLLAH